MSDSDRKGSFWKDGNIRGSIIFGLVIGGVFVVLRLVGVINQAAFWTMLLATPAGIAAAYGLFSAGGGAARTVFAVKTNVGR